MKRLVKHYSFLDHKKISFFFLGVGLTMFLLNVITIVNFLVLINALDYQVNVSLNGYYVSIISSVVLTTYSIYNLLEE